MKRRVWCVLAVGAAAAPALRAQPARRARLGVLHDAGRGPEFLALFKRLGERGWVEGGNLEIEFRTLDPDPDWRKSDRMARELAQLKCDVIFANGTPAALAAHAGAPQVPMVFNIGGDPVALGLVASLQRPGGHATGYIQQQSEIAGKQLSLLRDLAPTAKRIAVMFEGANPSMEQAVRTAEGAARRLGMTLRRFPLKDWRDVDAAQAVWMREPVDALLVPLDRVTGANATNIANMANRLRLPAVYGGRLFIEQGGMVSYGIDYPAQVIASADYLARILDGARPADLPVQQPTRFELVVNLHLAKVYGVTIPQSVLLQATEVIR
jgi:putative ABC transport system substrate-binding protein